MSDIRNIRPFGTVPPKKIFKVINGKLKEIKKAYRCINGKLVVVWDVSEKRVYNFITVWNINSDNIDFIFPAVETVGNDGYIKWSDEDKYHDYNSGNNYSHQFSATGTKTVMIECDITDITDNAFSKRSDLTEITLPKTIQNIGELAFSNCKALKIVEVKGDISTFGNLTELKRAMFYNCTSLQRISVNLQKTDIFKNIKIIRDMVFDNCSALQGTYNFENIERIEKYAFYNAKYVNPKLGSNLNFIGQYAFYNCGITGSVTIAKGVKNIPECAFMSCKSLYGITFENEGVETIDKEAFNGCTNLRSVNFGNKLNTIGTTAFNGCKNITSIAFEHIEQIGFLAFNACYGLTSVEIPSSVTSIDSMAFQSCTNLKTIKIHKPQDSIPDAPWSAGAWSGGVSDCNVIWLG